MRAKTREYLDRDAAEALPPSCWSVSAARRRDRDRRRLLAEPPALARRVVRARSAGVGRRFVGFEAGEAVLRFAVSNSTGSARFARASGEPPRRSARLNEKPRSRARPRVWPLEFCLPARVFRVRWRCQRPPAPFRPTRKRARRDSRLASRGTSSAAGTGDGGGGRLSGAAGQSETGGQATFSAAWAARTQEASGLFRRPRKWSVPSARPCRSSLIPRGDRLGRGARCGRGL